LSGKATAAAQTAIKSLAGAAHDDFVSHERWKL
jgi:hypothetical protein